MNGVCETDAACNVDMEMEVYDEIPYNVSQPTADAIYLNHELDKLDLNESPESPEDGVVETIEPYTTYNTLAEDMSSICLYILLTYYFFSHIILKSILNPDHL